MIVRGEVLDVSLVKGTSDNGAAYSYMRASILDRDGEAKVHPCRVSDNYGPTPAVGEYVVASASTYGSSGGRVSVTLIRPLAGPAFDALSA